jgi:hypothetical protein
MKKISLLFLLLFFYSCKEENNGVKLEILTNEFVCYSGDDYEFFSEEYQKNI